MNCPYCNCTCTIINYNNYPQFMEFQCFQIDHQFWSKSEAWYLRLIPSQLVVNSFGVCLANKLQHYLINFEERLTAQEAIPKLLQFIKLKAFI